MNMAKLGTVSAGGNNFHSTTKPNNGGACGLIPYTLCEQTRRPRRHGWRYGIAFYISAISGRRPFCQTFGACVRVLCNTRTYANGLATKNHPKTFRKPYRSRLSVFSPLKKYCSGFYIRHTAGNLPLPTCPDNLFGRLP